ncbi:MAG: chromosome segregation protein [Geminicoccaceae bacterium]|nr:chromosome segregation protein [Geminicoccaceae bacterium]
MRLTKLELQGFKSFADTTMLAFEPGVTAIVGPNGCGKSNVSDAVRWVLGEQRARLLRGAKMEEVIFQGSSARRAVNVAEVSLHFDNSEGALPIAFKEVVITRRLSRSGESEYLLNRASCRLRDIHDMLRGTGLGGDSGVVIEAKAIDALLSDRPDDRRELFEEAAGVGLYRDRRRSTERRLEETTLDLARIDDLIGEVQSQVRSLGRQRKRAERHSELMTRRFSVELTLASREMQAWREELATLETRVAELREFVPTAEADVSEAEMGRDVAHSSRAAAEAQRAELARLANAQREAAQRLRGEIAVAEERQRNALMRRQRAEEEQREGEAVGERVHADRERAASERSRLEDEVREAGEELRRRVAEEENARRVVGELRAAVESADRLARESRDQLRRLEIDREGAARELADIDQRATALESERATLGDAVELVMREVATADEAVELAQAEAERADSALAAARAGMAEAKENEATARHELFRADEALTALQGKVSALESLERERVGLAPAAARLLRDRAQFGDGGVLGPLSDFVNATASSALLVERYLGATVHAVVVRDREVAEAVRRWHATSNPGALLLLPLDAVNDAAEGAASGELVADVDAAAPAQAWVRALLGNVRALDDGAAFVDARGAVWLPGATGGPGPLRRRAELYALRAELIASETARQAASVAADAARTALAAANDRVGALSDEAANVHQQARRAVEQRAELGRRLQRAEREAAEASVLAARLESRASELRVRIASIDASATELGELIAERDAGTADARARLADAERAQDDAREQRTAGQVAEAQAQARLQVATDRERRLMEELSAASARLASLDHELSTLADADRSLAEQMASWQMDLDARDATLRDTDDRLTAAEEAVRAADTALTEAEHALDDVRRRAHQAADELHHAELRFTELSGRRTAIRERLETEWRKPLDELLTSFTPVEVDDDTLRAEMEQLRAQLDSLGVVNPLAIEEHEEETRRLDFLTSQRADLADAKNSLALAIREIDATARELFLATFTQVRENFRQIFMTLFGGGECDLRLENPEQPLDCDIEIHASPRGKRTQRIHLLSSGERALVALSLLFGIFLTKPSPFCLLDEVDAPLDDANIGRFVRMLNQFKSKTQFIVITHNPRTTTEAADAVYGVTMQEPGVSSIVSVRMRGAAVEDTDAQGEEAEVVAASA